MYETVPVLFGPNNMHNSLQRSSAQNNFFLNNPLRSHTNFEDTTEYFSTWSNVFKKSFFKKAL